jgi:hypothetical protein
MKTALKLLALLPVLTVSSTLLATPSDFALSADLGSTRQAGDGESGTAFSGSVGLSYQITPSWSVLLNYTDSGEADLFSLNDTFAGDDIIYEATMSLDNTGIGLFAQYTTERQLQQWAFGGRIGLVRWESDVNATVHAASELDLNVVSDRGTDLAAALVAQYALTEKWDLTLGLDYLRYNISFEEDSTDVTNTRLYIGLKNSF